MNLVKKLGASCAVAQRLSSFLFNTGRGLNLGRDAMGFVFKKCSLGYSIRLDFCDLDVNLMRQVNAFSHLKMGKCR